MLFEIAQHAPGVPDAVNLYAASFEHAAGALEIVAQKASFTIATVFLAYKVIVNEINAALEEKRRAARHARRTSRKGGLTDQQ